MNCDLRILFRALRQWPTDVAWAEKQPAQKKARKEWAGKARCLVPRTGGMAACMSHSDCRHGFLSCQIPVITPVCISRTR